MERIVAAICVLALLAGPATGQTATAPADKTATTRPAGGEKADEEPEEAIPAALLAASKASFVVVEVWYKKDTAESKAFVERDWQARRIYEDYIDKKRPSETTGLVLDAQGHILVVDGGLEDRFLDKIVVQDVTGARYPARREKLLIGTSGVLLKVDAKAAAKLKPLKFAELKDEGVNTSLLAAALYKTDDKWRLRAAPVRPSVGFGKGEDENAFFGSAASAYYARRYGGASSAVGLIANEDGEPLGCSVSSRLDLRQAESLWLGPDLIKAQAVPWQQLAGAREKIRAQLIKATHEIVIRFHQGADKSRYSEGGGAAGSESTAYGYAISPTEILVPMHMDSKQAAKVDKFFVKFSPRDRRPADWVGAYKDVGAFVIKLSKGKLPAHLQLAGKDLLRMRPFWVARPRKRYGKTYVDVTINRLYGKARGYAGEHHWYPLRRIEGGAMLVDFTGRLAGMYLRQKTEHEEERRLERTRSYYGGPSGDEDARVFLVSEIRDELTKPTAHLDAKIKVKTRTESKRRNWFGVEFVPMSSDLAEQFKVEKPTRDGRVGFLINAVYPSSPAAKIGLKAGDILLKIQAPGMPYPIELASQLAGDRMGGYGRRWYPGMGDDGEFGSPGATWKNRLNFLTRAMDAIGTGKSVRIIYYRRGEGKEVPGKAVTVDYKIELAPPDFESAPKWKNRKIGITAKDLTYEVRLALNLKSDAPGVVVARIEPGSPAMIGRIFPNELITTADDKPITSARQLRDCIAAAKKAGKDKVRLTILRLGNTRFADLTIKAYDQADDEGLDEEKEEGSSPTTAPAK